MEKQNHDLGYKMPLCRGLVLLTVVNFQPRFHLMNCAVSSHSSRRPLPVPMCIWIQAVLYESENIS